MRLWIIKSNLISGQENSIEMVLINEKSCKIHATVRRHLIHLFKGVLKGAPDSLPVVVIQFGKIRYFRGKPFCC
ncbi:unnamed protein product [Trifolium pratense]|uniref:Uncharacterized protein n=1 Tax=Trifolium pratense TaxID=57577 RepID=A0ACB0INC3_TRIPR|nr:unnamed protein product [Trifolium pratense]